MPLTIAVACAPALAVAERKATAIMVMGDNWRRPASLRALDSESARSMRTETTQ